MSAISEVEIKVVPSKAFDASYIHAEALQKAGLSGNKNAVAVLTKRSIDARGKNPMYLLRFEIYTDSSIPEQHPVSDLYASVKDAKRVIVIGAGPAGYWAALELIELGFKPIVLDRGKDVVANPV